MSKIIGLVPEVKNEPKAEVKTTSAKAPSEKKESKKEK